ncbi:hypothetical protein [Rhodococcus sp. NPDC004095]
MGERFPLEHGPVTKATVEAISALKHLLNPETLSDKELDRAEVLLEDLMTDTAQLGDKVRAEKQRRAQS